MSGGILIPIPSGGNVFESKQMIQPVVLPDNFTLHMVNMMAADLIDAEGPLQVHEITTEVLAFSLIQDGVYEYNKRASYVIQKACDVFTAFEGDIVLYVISEPQVLSR